MPQGTNASAVAVCHSVRLSPSSTAPLARSLHRAADRMAQTLPLDVLVSPAGTSKDGLVGTKLNGFVITGALSVGGMGVVYEARHPLIDRRAAVKVIRPELCNDVDLSARFLRE